MKSYYLMRCRTANENRLLRKLDPFPHFKDDARRFSLLDLKALHSGDLLPVLTAIHEEYTTHIKRECLVSARTNQFTCLLGPVCVF